MKASGSKYPFRKGGLSNFFAAYFFAKRSRRGARSSSHRAFPFRLTANKFCRRYPARRISGITSAHPVHTWQAYGLFNFVPPPSAFHTAARDSYCESSTCAPVEIFPRRFGGHYGFPISWMISRTKAQWRGRMANAIREKWKNNWPDAYASPGAFQEYITESRIVRSRFIPPLVYLRLAPPYIKVSRVARERKFWIVSIIVVRPSL